MKHIKLVVALLIPLSSAAAYAGGWKDVHVTDVAIYTAGGPAGKGCVVVTFSSNGTGSPSCASGYPRNLVIDLTTDGGKTAAGAVHMSLLTGSTVTATGAGSCSVNPAMETMASIERTSEMRDR